MCIRNDYKTFWQIYEGLPEGEERDRGRRFPGEVSTSGRTDSMAAVRLLRFESFAPFPPLSEEPTEECRSSGSETTLQSSLGGPPPVELPPERVSDLLGGEDGVPLSRMVACSASFTSPVRSSGAPDRLMSVRAYSKSR
jgi:hypothetical protein